MKVKENIEIQFEMYAHSVNHKKWELKEIIFFFFIIHHNGHVYRSLQTIILVLVIIKSVENIDSLRFILKQNQ